MHELATNALKYGALSESSGLVDIAWVDIDDGILELRWTERGGPPVVPPTATGFGTLVLRTSIPDSDIEMAYLPEGFRFCLRFRSEKLA